MIKENVKTNSFIKIFSTVTSNRIFWILSFSILTSISAQISIPVKPVPFTLQTMMVVLAGAFLGAKDGAYSQVFYLFLGIIGLPVFAHSPDGFYGIARLMGPTGGYLLAFPLAAFITGYLIEKNQKYIPVILSMFAGNILVIITGALFLDLFFIHNFSESLKIGAVIFSVWTVVKVFVSASIYFGVKKINKK